MVEAEFPECRTFGSVIRFSLELEKVASAVYDEMAANAGLASAAETFKALSAAHKKRTDLLEHTRREKLNEMILEPIQDLNRDDYMIPTEIPGSLDVKSAAQFASKIEETSSRFYSDSSKVAKMLLAEAARIMDRLGKENMSFKAKLDAL